MSSQAQPAPNRDHRPRTLLRRVSGLVVATALLSAALVTPAKAATGPRVSAATPAASAGRAPSARSAAAAAVPCHVAVSDPAPRTPGSVLVTVHTSARARAAFTSTPASQPPTVNLTANSAGAAAVRYTLTSGMTGRFTVRVAVTTTAGKRASCSSFFIINGKRPTGAPSVAPPPRPRGATAARAASFAAGSMLNYGFDCNYYYNQVTSSTSNMSPYTVYIYEHLFDWSQGVWIDRSGSWLELGSGGINTNLTTVSFHTNVSMYITYYTWDGVNLYGPSGGWGMSGGTGAYTDGNGLYWCMP